MYKRPKPNAQLILFVEIIENTTIITYKNITLFQTINRVYNI